MNDLPQIKVDIIQNEFISGKDVNIIAEHHGVDAYLIAEMAVEQQWLVDHTVDVHATETRDHFKSLCYKAASSTLVIVNSSLAKIAKEIEEKPDEKISASYLKDLASVANSMQRVGQLALGDATEIKKTTKEVSEGDMEIINRALKASGEDVITITAEMIEPGKEKKNGKQQGTKRTSKE